MKKWFLYLFVILSFNTIFTACGGGGREGKKSSIDNVVIDAQAFYIDAQDGNDSNDGKTPQSAWRTLAKVNNTTINAANKILFRVGQKWIGQLNIKNSGTQNNPIIISSYGQGDKPIISSVGKQHIDKWYQYNEQDGIRGTLKEPINDQENTYLAVILENHPHRIKINNREILGTYDSTEIDNTFKWAYSRDIDANIFYYYGDDKPNKIETNLYSAPIYTHNNAYVIIDSLVLQGGFTASVYIENASNITVKNCDIGEMSKQGKAENTTVQNILIDNCNIDSKYTFDYSLADGPDKNGRTVTTRGAPEGIFFWGGVQNSTISNNTIKNWTHSSINLATGSGEELINNKIFNNNISAPDIAYGGRITLDGSNTYNNKVYENQIKNLKSSIQFNGHDNSFYNNIVENIQTSQLKPEETGYGIIVEGYASAVSNNSIINNTFKNISKNPIEISDKGQFGVTNIIKEPNNYE
jgi:parallel beta-helix repeat protein